MDEGLHSRHILINYASLLFSCKDVLESVSDTEKLDKIPYIRKFAKRLLKDSYGREIVSKYFDYEISEENVIKLDRILERLSNGKLNEEEISSELKHISETVRNLPDSRKVSIKLSWFESLFFLINSKVLNLL